jgi:hypothetical protein
MAGPHPPHHGARADGPPYTEPHPSQPIPSQHAQPSTNDAAPPSGGYPGRLPPPVSYPRRARRRFIIGVLLAFGLIAGMTAVIVYGVRENRSSPAGPLSDQAAKVAIQGYLDALQHRDLDTIARNTLCGIYDAVRDRRSDQALAKLSSDAFRKQFSQAQVTSIDKIVYWSRYQAQVLFSMRVVPATGGPPRDGVQGLAQLLLQHNQILVCSYVLRTAGMY